MVSPHLLIRLKRLGRTQEQIAEEVRLSQKRVSEIIGNTKFGKIDNLLSQGWNMDYIARHYHIDLPLAWAIRLEGNTDQERFEELGWGLPREIRESDSETYFTEGFVPGINGILTTVMDASEMIGLPAIGFAFR